MHRQLRLILTLLAAFLAWQTEGKGDDAGPDFYATVQDNFAKWDTNNDGSLSSDEILAAFANPDYHGRAAAAIAVLQKLETRHVGHHEETESFTLDQILQMRDQAKNGHDKNEATFKNYLKRIAAGSTDLFVHGIPQIDEIVQGGANDCYLISVIASLAYQRPLELSRMIQQGADGNYVVHFASVAPIKVSRLTESEAIAYNSSRDGLWLPILVKAFGEYKLAHGWDTTEATPVAEDPVEAVAIHGGNCAQVIKLFTGHGVKSHKPKDIEKDLRNQLTAAINERRVVVVGVPHHAMTAIAYDSKSDRIEIWNPWGSTSQFKTLDVKMQHGFFAIPISEFVEKCNNIMFEDPTVKANTKGDHPKKVGKGAAKNAAD